MHSNLELEPLLLKSKISIPLLPTEFVHRKRLTDQISQAVKGPLTVVSAPAGYGKTNLLIEWAAETELPVAWLTIDSEDNDLNRFFCYLIGALQIPVPGLGEEALDFIQSTRGGGLEVGLTLLLNEIFALQREIVLILDEFQALENQTIFRSIVFILKHLPSNLHLVIASRSEPALDLAFLRAKGWVVELGTNELRFTSDEIESFFQKTIVIQLAPEIITMLEEKTDGWITGLQMAAISLRHQSDPTTLLANFQGDAHYVVDFLAEEVLNKQPEEIRQFLLQSSILEKFCGSLCEAVINPESQPGYGAVMLDRLEHANLFVVALDPEHEWFSYHRLFADFLYHIRAETNPTEIPLMQKRAALWFEQRANLNESIKYAIASGDAEWAADLIGRNIEIMIKSGEVFSLTHWIGKLPGEVIHQHPQISLVYAWGLITSYQLDTAMYWLDDLQRVLRKRKHQLGETTVSEDQETARSWNINGGLAICQSTLALINGDVEQAAKFSREAANYLQEENPFIRSMLSFENSLYHVLSGDTIKAIDSLRKTVRIATQAKNQLFMLIATCHLAEMQAMRGQLSQASVTLEKAQFMFLNPDGNPHPLAGIVDIEFGKILLERDELDKAREYLERGCQITKNMWSFSSLEGMISLARLLQIQSDRSGSQMLLTEASQIALSTESSQWDDALVSATAVRLALQHNDLTTAHQWWKKGGFPDLVDEIALEDYPYHIYEYICLTQVRFILAMCRETANVNQLYGVLEILESLQHTAERFKRVTSQIEILILQSLTQGVMENDNLAVEILLNALALSEPEGYRRIFLDEGYSLADILASCQRVQKERVGILPSPGYIESLLDVIPPVGMTDQASSQVALDQGELPIARTEYGLLISLSPREMEVLSLIADGKSNKEIAAQLCLSLNTVKRHAYNIYAKLEVKKRTHAVSKARQLGLIS